MIWLVLFLTHNFTKHFIVVKSHLFSLKTIQIDEFLFKIKYLTPHSYLRQKCDLNGIMAVFLLSLHFFN